MPARPVLLQLRHELRARQRLVLAASVALRVLLAVALADVSDTSSSGGGATVNDCCASEPAALTDTNGTAGAIGIATAVAIAAASSLTRSSGPDIACMRLHAERVPTY